MDYELIDSGVQEKLERFGPYVLRRPDPQALWERAQSGVLWDTCDAHFIRKGERGEWHFNKELPKEWPIEFGGFTFLIRPTSFKHVGLFPEQLSNWEWLVNELGTGYTQPNVLNLFAYTGGATIAALKAGATVTHIDASRTAVEWARKNADLSGLPDPKVRWVVEDVMRYVDREIKRGSKYDGIILDPPAFGHGPKDELWKIEEDLVPLMRKCRSLIRAEPSFILMTGYAAGYSHLAFEHLLEPLQKIHGGSVEGGELTIKEKDTMRLLPAGIYARFAAGRS